MLKSVTFNRRLLLCFRLFLGSQITSVSSELIQCSLRFIGNKLVMIEIFFNDFSHFDLLRSLKTKSQCISSACIVTYWWYHLFHASMITKPPHQTAASFIYIIA